MRWFLTVSRAPEGRPRTSSWLGTCHHLGQPVLGVGGAWLHGATGTPSPSLGRWPWGSLLCGQESQQRGLGGGVGGCSRVGGAPPGPSPPHPPPLAPGASQSGSPTHPVPPNLCPHRTPGSPVSPAFIQASLRPLPQRGYLCVRGRDVSRPRESSANTDQLWAWLLLPASSCSHPIKALPQVPRGTSYVVLRDRPLRGRCLRPPHRQPRARPWGGAPGVLPAAGESVWRRPAWGCPACFPRSWPDSCPWVPGCLGNLGPGAGPARVAG